MASRVVLLALLVVGSACVQCIHGHEAVDTPSEAPEARLQVILDVDPSGLVDLGMDLDDDLALIALLGSPEVDLLGVTVTYGNTFLASALENVHSLLRITGRQDVPVAHGADWWFGPGVANGKSDPALPTPASRFIIDVVRQKDEGTVTIIALGALTNVGCATCGAALRASCPGASRRWHLLSPQPQTYRGSFVS